MVTPLLLIMVVLTTGCGWVPKRWITIPFFTGQGSLPLLATKFAANNLASGVSAKAFFDFFPAALLEAAMASRIKRLISRSIAVALIAFA